MPDKVSGYVYLAINPQMPYCLKVGMTTRDPRTRIAEFNGTGTPVPHRLLKAWPVTNARLAESAAHKELADCRTASNREFFHVEPPEAMSRVGRAISQYRTADSLLPAKLADEIREKCAKAIKKMFYREPASHEMLEANLIELSMEHAVAAIEDGLTPRVVLDVIDITSEQLID